MIPLGFEVGSGAKIFIPQAHTVFIGQSQRAGKSTALEACATRSQNDTIAFMTKRGESAFRLAREIAPYYEDRIDWRTVRSLCEALTEEKWDKFQRQCLRSVCRAGSAGRPGSKLFAEWPKPETLEDVIRNVTTALEKATGQRELIFGEIQDDLRTATEELSKLQASCATPELEPGLNVVNLERYEFHIQSLIIRSLVRWVHQNAEGTTIALPEAWKFAPAVRRSPVRDVAEEFIRQGAGLGNFLWIDSQNISGISSVLLSQMRVWLFGVQRLKAEIEKTLDAIPDNIYPRPSRGDIATLQLGQFIVCFDGELFPVYVQPAWLSASHAEAVARGEEPIESVRAVAREFDQERAAHDGE